MSCIGRARYRTFFRLMSSPKNRDGSSNKQPKTLETQRGRWDDLVYTLPLGGDINTAIKLELGYLGGMVQQEFIFKGSSSSSGPITLATSSGGLGTMPALMVGKQGNR